MKLIDAIGADPKLKALVVDKIIRQLDGRHGWKLVPIEPTEEQWEEGKWLSGQFAYRAMLAVSPDPLGED